MFVSVVLQRIFADFQSELVRTKGETLEIFTVQGVITAVPAIDCSEDANVVFTRTILPLKSLALRVTSGQSNVCNHPMYSFFTA